MVTLGVVLLVTTVVFPWNPIPMEDSSNFAADLGISGTLWQAGTLDDAEFEGWASWWLTLLALLVLLTTGVITCYNRLTNWDEPPRT